jgi:EAL domain-containing protein (putative c-di-GMP-specific phosphodiesterase class I)
VHHKLRGILHPRDFIPLAVASGQERVLTNIAAARSFLELRSGLLSPGMYMTLNLPMITVLHEPAALRGLELCQVAGITPERIVLEVLENSTAPDVAILGRAMDGWRDAGFRMAIDDAGPNLPHWRTLIDLPFDFLKLDGAMVADPAAHDQVERIVTAAKRRGLTVVAEGIEDESCLARMRALGVDAVQGFLFSRPLPSLAVPVWLRQWDPATLSAAAVRAA